MVPEPYPIGSWRVAGYRLEVRRGERGKKGVPENDRVLLVNDRKISFERYLAEHIRGRWPDEVDEWIRRFFFRNENAVFPKSLGFAGAGLFHNTLIIAEEMGLESAFAYIGYTKGASNAF